MLQSIIDKLSLKLGLTFKNSGAKSTVKSSIIQGDMVGRDQHNHNYYVDSAGAPITPDDFVSEMREGVILLIRDYIVEYVQNNVRPNYAAMALFITQNGHKMAKHPATHAMHHFMAVLQERMCKATSRQVDGNRQEEAAAWIGRCCDLFSNLSPAYKKRLADFDFSVDSV